MALTEQQKSSIRRHLKYGNIGLTISAAGGGTLGANAGWRYFGDWGDLEIRLDSLEPVDEAVITGLPYGVIILQGLDPNNGDQLSIQISGGGLSSPQTVTTVASGDTRDEFALAVAAKFAQNPLINAAQITALSPMGGGRTGVENPISEIQFVAKSAFTLSILSMTGNIGASISANGIQTDVQQIIGGTPYIGLLPICNQLYSLIGSASDRMGVDKADVFTARKTEFKERRELYRMAVNDLADFLVARINPDANGRRSNIGTL